MAMPDAFTALSTDASAPSIWFVACHCLTAIVNRCAVWRRRLLSVDGRRHFWNSRKSFTRENKSIKRRAR